MTATIALTLAITVLTAVPVAAAANLSPRAPAAAAGTALAWGDNHSGQLGDGTIIDRHQPVGVQLPSGTTVTALATGGKHSIALTSAGTVLAWGSNHFGQLGDGKTVDSHTPVQVAMPKGTVVTAIAAGGTHSLAATAAGTVFAWGDNQYGQLGDGTTVASDVPVRVRLPRGA
jgi:alpha-tubulin suppressor-like RCC1 family protein